MDVDGLALLDPSCLLLLEEGNVTVLLATGVGRTKAETCMIPLRRRRQKENMIHYCVSRITVPDAMHYGERR